MISTLIAVLIWSVIIGLAVGILVWRDRAMQRRMPRAGTTIIDSIRGLFVMLGVTCWLAFYIVFFAALLFGLIFVVKVMWSAA